MTNRPDRGLPWVRIFVEGTVIVGSILLALAADAWWDGRQERAEEQEILQGLAVDFEANQRELDITRDALHAVGRSLIRLSEIPTAEIATTPDDSVNRYARAVNAANTFDERSGTLDAVISSGKLGLIRDLQLREMLVEWKSLVADAEERAEALSDVNRRVLERSAELGGPWSGTGRGPMHELPETREIAESVPIIDLGAVKAYSGLMAALRQKRLTVGFYILGLVPLSEMAERVLGRLGPIPR